MLRSITYAYLILSALLALGLAARLAWPRISRRLGRVPAADQAAIELFLANRDETALEVKREIWVRSPQGGLASARIYGWPTRGRFYQVVSPMTPKALATATNSPSPAIKDRAT